MSYPKYPAYKDSEVQWLGNIPQEWEIQRLKHFIKLQKGKNPTKFSYDINDLPYLTMEYLRGVKNNISYVVPQENLIKIKKDSLLVLWDGANAGEIILSKQGYLSSTMSEIKINSKFFIKRYFYFYLKSFEKLFKDFANGTTIPHFNSNLLIDEPHTIPTKSEQEKIADFLDYKVGLIEEYVGKKKKMIELLGERKQAVINEAVCKGLDKNAPTKASSIDWLGNIPKHWEVRKLKYFVSCNDEALSNQTDSEFQLRYIDIGNVDKHGNIFDIVIYNFHDAPSRARRIVRKDDIIISTVRTYLKAITQIKGEIDNLIVSTGFAVLRPQKEILSDFLNNAVHANYFIEKVCSDSFGVSYPAINASELIQIKIAIPSLPEQKQIVAYIEEESVKIDKLKEKIKRQIALMEEYKTALISEAVTGKIDVRSYEIAKSSCANFAQVEIDNNSNPKYSKMEQFENS